MAGFLLFTHSPSRRMIVNLAAVNRVQPQGDGSLSFLMCDGRDLDVPGGFEIIPLENAAAVAAALWRSGKGEEP